MLSWKLIRGLNEADAKRLVEIVDSLDNHDSPEDWVELANLEALALKRIEEEAVRVCPHEKVTDRGDFVGRCVACGAYMVSVRPASQDAPGSTE